jgi:hypothetical protein
MDPVAGVENLMVAMAAYEAACRHWPDETIISRRLTDFDRTELVGFICARLRICPVARTRL